MPQAVVAPRAKEVVSDVGMVPADEENTDVKWSLEGFANEDYGSDEDKCRDYIKTMKAVIQKGINVAIDAMTRRREWHLI